MLFLYAEYMFEVYETTLSIMLILANIQDQEALFTQASQLPQYREFDKTAGLH
jgi:hypothetical protein